MNKRQQEALELHYEMYNDVIKPLIAAYEAREQSFPTPIFNEIRAFNDHIARCYLNNKSSKFIDEQLTRAGRHIHRIILDLYKYLIISFDDFIKKFEKNTKMIDLSLISDGKFYVKYSDLRETGITAIREAKQLESSGNEGQEGAYEMFEKAFNLYQDTESLILSNFSKIRWARVKTALKKSLWFWAAIISGILSFLLADFLNSNLFDTIWEWIKN
ncbi:MAG: hypothetical protein KAS71_01460 [Bacteroidales bacterium]|nr:hypothetical protein [Bacteroidales bacterium]